MDYKIRIFIPSLKKFNYITEIKNRETLAISKYIKANDDYGLSVYFENLLKDSQATNIVDKFFVLCQLRALNLSNKITFNGKHISGSDATFKVNLFAFLQNYLNFSENLQKDYEYISGDLKIYFTLPKNIFFKNFFALLADIITKIEYEGDDLLKNKSIAEKFEIITKLNDEILKGLKEHLNSINNQSDLFLLKPADDIAVPTIKISFFNNTVFSVLKSIFKTEITYFYNKFFICLTKMGLSLEDFLQLSFVETDILLNIYKSANKLK